MATQVSHALSIDLDYYDLVSVPEDLRNEKLIRKNDMLPLAKRGRNMYLAVIDPTNIAAIEDFEFNTGLNAEVVVVEFDKLQKLIEKLFDSSFNLAGDAGDWDLGSLGITEEVEEEGGVSTDKKTSRLSLLLIKCCWMRFVKAPRTCTLNPMKNCTGSAFG